MRIVITAVDKTLDSEVDPRFGRCNYFLVVDINDKEIKNLEVIENKAKDQSRGAGVMAAETVINLKPDYLVTSHLGPRSQEILDRFNIKTVFKTGPIKTIIDELSSL